LTDTEKEAAAPLRCPQAQAPDASPGTEALSFQERLAKRLKTEEQDPSKEYINCDFILGSAAEVERLRSIAGKVFPKDRANMHPIQVEALLFLRINKRFGKSKRLWNLSGGQNKKHLQNTRNSLRLVVTWNVNF
jgi:hypothetical protein